MFYITWNFRGSMQKCLLVVVGCVFFVFCCCCFLGGFFVFYNCFVMFLVIVRYCEIVYYLAARCTYIFNDTEHDVKE